MTDEQLVATLKKLQDEARQLSEERNFFKVERDQIATFQAIWDKELNESQASVFNKERELEEGEEEHQLLIKVYKQKVKHMLFEFSHAVDHHHREHGSRATEISAEAAHRADQLIAEKRILKRGARELQAEQEEEVRKMKKSMAEEIQEVKDELRGKEDKLLETWEGRIKELREDLELRMKTEVHEIEERKNLQLSTLSKQHDKAFSEMKTYYNDITLNNLALINSLKDQSSGLSAQSANHSQQTVTLLAQNKTLSQPLAQARATCDNLRRDLTHYDKLKASLKMVTERCKEMERKVEEAKIECERMNMRMRTAEEEQSRLAGGWAEGMNQALDTSGADTQRKVLESAARQILDDLQKKDAQLTAILASLPPPLRTVSQASPTSRRTSHRQPANHATELSRPDVPPGASGKATLTVDKAKSIMATVEKLLDKKNGRVRELKIELERASKAHRVLKNVVEAKLTEVGIQLGE
ncbi:Dynein regulatory complex subunit 4 [Gonapodya sp. JEL0774]|nr:Dynein regulatory complex subunit 4 [Gonapodya sp. JEL0774]